jgi:hypothetical protein
MNNRMHLAGAIAPLTATDAGPTQIMCHGLRLDVVGFDDLAIAFQGDDLKPYPCQILLGARFSRTDSAPADSGLDEKAIAS